MCFFYHQSKCFEEQCRKRHIKLIFHRSRTLHLAEFLLQYIQTHIDLEKKCLCIKRRDFRYKKEFYIIKLLVCKQVALSFFLPESHLLRVHAVQNFRIGKYSAFGKSYKFILLVKKTFDFAVLEYQQIIFSKWKKFFKLCSRINLTNYQFLFRTINNIISLEYY